MKRIQNINIILKDKIKADLDYHLQLLFPLLHNLYFTVGDHKYLIFDKAISIGKYNKYFKQFRFSKIESFLNVLFTINNHVWPKESTRVSDVPPHCQNPLSSSCLSSF